MNVQLYLSLFAASLSGGVFLHRISTPKYYIESPFWRLEMKRWRIIKPIVGVLTAGTNSIMRYNLRRFVLTVNGRFVGFVRTGQLFSLYLSEKAMSFRNLAQAYKLVFSFRRTRLNSWRR